MDIEKLVRENIDKIVHLSLGTSRDNKPWVCEVHFAYDDELSLYYRSLPSRRHSEDIDRNPQVAGTIVRQHAVDEVPLGLYFEGVAEMMEPGEAQDQAAQYINDRLNAGDDILEQAKDPAGHQFYKISVETFYVFGVFDGRGQKLELKWGLSRDG